MPCFGFRVNFSCKLKYNYIVFLFPSSPSNLSHVPLLSLKFMASFPLIVIILSTSLSPSYPPSPSLLLYPSLWYNLLVAYNVVCMYIMSGLSTWYQINHWGGLALPLGNIIFLSQHSLVATFLCPGLGPMLLLFVCFCYLRQHLVLCTQNALEILTILHDSVSQILEWETCTTMPDSVLAVFCVHSSLTYLCSFGVSN